MTSSPEQGWWTKAQCAGADTEGFFYDGGNRYETRAFNKWVIQTFCHTCPVIQQCYDAAMAEEGPSGLRYGIRGGMTALQRRQLNWPSRQREQGTEDIA